MPTTKTFVDSLAPGGTSVLDGDAVAIGVTGKLAAVSAGGTAGARWDVCSVDGGEEILDTFYTSEKRLWKMWRPPSREWFPLVGDGARRFRVKVTNLDNSEAVDFHATIYWGEA